MLVLWLTTAAKTLKLSYTSEFGPVTKTDDSALLKQWLAALTVDGGGDISELALHGIRLALHEVRSGSACFVFTDAPAKDEHLKSEVLALATDKKVSVCSKSSWQRNLYHTA